MPPVAFVVVFLTVSIFTLWLSRCAFPKGKSTEGSKKAYACGEDFTQHLIQPDYSQFFPFAFFFTILHVVALIIATVPTGTMTPFFIAAIYCLGAIVGLVTLLRK